MDIFKTIKCIFCLAKCSKILYYIKKLLCIAGIGVAIVFTLCALKDDKKLMKKLKVM